MNIFHIGNRKKDKKGSETNYIRKTYFCLSHQTLA